MVPIFLYKIGKILIRKYNQNCWKTQIAMIKFKYRNNLYKTKEGEK